MDKILVLPGDGIGPSIICSAVKVLEVLTSDIEFVRGDIGFSAYEKTGKYLPIETMDLAGECGTILCGPVGVAAGETGSSADPLNVFKTRLDLYGMIRCFSTFADDLGKPDLNLTLWCCSDTDKDIVETKDLNGVTISKFIGTSAYSRMMARALNDLEMSGLTKVVCLTRDDMFPESSALFNEMFESMFSSDRYQLETMNVSRWASRFVRDPYSHEFVICADMYAQVAAGMMAGFTGGNHLSPVGFVGDSNTLLMPGNLSTFENMPEGMANPTSAIYAASMALFNTGRRKEALDVLSAVKAAYASGARTCEFGGAMTTAEFTDRIISNL